MDVKDNEIDHGQCNDCSCTCEFQNEEKEFVGVMGKKQKKRLERNMHDINICDVGNNVDSEHVHEKSVDVMVVSLNPQGNCDGTHVGEVFSMPRVVPVAESKNLVCCGSFDVGTGWDFLKSEHRQLCRERLRKSKPRVLVLSPPCGPFSALQRISQGKGDPIERRRKLIEGRILLDFAMELCEFQVENNNVFVFEHPLNAASWSEECVERVKKMKGVHEIVLDQCCFGLKDPVSGKLFRKATKIMTNSQHAEHLGRRCKGDHEHQAIEGQIKLGGRWINRSVCAQIYPKGLVQGLVKLVQHEVKQHVFEVHASEVLLGKSKEVDVEAGVMRCHINLGHPSKERFIHMLKSANASEKAIECAKLLKCSTCASKRLQDSHAVAKHKRAEAFNQQINMDTFDLPIYQQKVLKMLNILDEGTGLQLCLPLWKGARASEVRKSYRKNWKRWAGVPQKILTDGGPEFDGEAQEGFDLDGSYTEKTAAYAPWQNGAAERYGGIWKTVFAKAFEENQPRNKKEVNELIDQVNVARNSMTKKNGFSPYQHVFGNELRLPGLISEGESMLPLYDGRGATHSQDAFHERQKVRMAARKAMVQIDEDEKVRRALDHRTRPPKDQFHVGQMVYFWRRIRDDNKKGSWKGPARVIGFYDSSKIWICHGNKVLRCAPEQLRAMTEDQEAAIRFLPLELVSPAGKFAKRGAQTFLDISKHERPSDIDLEEPLPKRSRNDMEVSGGSEIGARETIEEPQSWQVPVGHDDMDTEEIREGGGENEESTKLDTDSIQLESEQQNAETDEGRDIAGNLYGPIRTGTSRHGGPDHELTQALRRSSELLDLGDVRVSRTPYDRSKEDPPEALEVAICSDDEDEYEDKHFETFMANLDRHVEIKDKDLSEHDWKEVNTGKEKELSKLIKTKAVKIYIGEDAERIRRMTASKRILESRFVKTRRPMPDQPDKMEVKCRWVVKGFQDPDIATLERQSPTLTADGLSCVLQILASMRWTLNVADVEGAFLQGENYDRETGPIFASMPKDTFPGIPSDAIFQLTKCVYGLMDAPLRWWKCLSGTIRQLGMKQSELDPCIFYWFHQQQLAGVIAAHVDDLLLGGNAEFLEQVVKPLKEKYPFKHWKVNQSEFLGRRLTQNNDFSIVIDQQDYANNVRSANISKERRKFKEERLNSQELKQYRNILGAANWLVGSSRPDIAAMTALLQQRINCATIDDLISANKLIAKIKDFSHTKIVIQSIPFSEAMILVASDSSWGNTDDLGNQAGYFTLLAHQDIDKKVWATVSPLRWKSYKVDRKTPSTLGAELIAVSRAIAEGNWLRSMFGEALNYNYELHRDKEFRDGFKLNVLVDCKPIYDHVQGEQSIIKDKRLAIEMLIVRRDLRNQNSELRWVDTRQMLSDPLTKVNADCSFLRFVLKKNKMIVVEETDQLLWRQGEKKASA